MRLAIAMPRVVIASGLAMLLSLLPATRAAAQGEPEGFPDPGRMLVDPDFKVSTREFGLDRRVEMYQWRVADGKFERVWHEALIDSTGLDAARIRRNCRWRIAAGGRRTRPWTANRSIRRCCAVSANGAYCARVFRACPPISPHRSNPKARGWAVPRIRWNRR